MTNDSQLEAALAALERSQADVAAIVRQLRRFPTELPVGTVLRFTKAYKVDHGDDEEFRRYDYVAFRTSAEGWYLTGLRQLKRHSWANLVKFIGDASVDVVTGWRPVEQWYAAGGDQRANPGSATDQVTDETTSSPGTGTQHPLGLLFAPLKEPAWDEGYAARGRNNPVNPYRRPRS